MLENSNLIASREDELEEVLLEMIVVAANLLKNINAVKHKSRIGKGGKKIDEENIRMLTAFF